MQDKEQPSKPKHSLMRQILHGAICCNAGMFFVAPVVATLYQFPTFPNGKVGGLEGLFTSGWAETLLAVWFTLIVFILAGGFVVLGLFGGIAGGVSYKVFGASLNNLYWRTAGCALVVDIMIASLLALAADVLAPHLMFYS